MPPIRMELFPTGLSLATAAVPHRTLEQASKNEKEKQKQKHENKI